MTPQDKAVLLMYRNTLLTQAEVASKLGIKASQVNTVIHKHISADERKQLVSMRRSKARTAQVTHKQCPNCGHKL